MNAQTFAEQFVLEAERILTSVSLLLTSEQTLSNREERRVDGILIRLG